MKFLFLSILVFVISMQAFACNSTQVVSFTKPSFGCMDSVVNFVNTSTRTTGWFWTWDFGDGQNDYTPNTHHTYLTSGNFIVTLTADSGGCAHVVKQDTFLVGTCGSSGICNASAPTSYVGYFTPSDNDLPCVNVGQRYDTTLTWKTPMKFAKEYGFSKVDIDSMRIDSIHNLPCGLNWMMNKYPYNTYQAGEVGCIRLSGLTNDSVGEYELAVDCTVWFSDSTSQQYHHQVNQYYPYYGNDMELMQYFIRVADSNNCPMIRHVHERVSSCNPLQPLGILNADTSIHICAGDDYQIFYCVPFGGGGQYHYNWSPQQGLSCTDCQYPVFDGKHTQQYILTITDTRGDTLRQNVKVYIDTIKSVQLSLSPFPACSGQNYSLYTNQKNISGYFDWFYNGSAYYMNMDSFNQPLQLSSGGNVGDVYYVAYQPVVPCATQRWYFSNPIILNDCTGPLTAIGYSQNSTCTGDSALLYTTGSGGTGHYQYKWLTGRNYLTNPDSNYTMAFPPLTTDFVLRITDGVDTVFDTIVQVIAQVPAIDAGRDFSVCTGAHYELLPASDGQTLCYWGTPEYGFSTQLANGAPQRRLADSSRTFYLKGVYDGGFRYGAIIECAVYDTIRVTVVDSAPAMVNIWTDHSGCGHENNPMNYYASPSNVGPHPTFDWIDDYGIQSGTAAEYHTGFGTGSLSVRCVLHSDLGCATPKVDTSNVITVYSCDTTGINELTTNPIKVYPNPAQSNITIEWRDDNRIADIIVYDLVGRVVLQQKITGGKAVLDIGYLPAGAYMYRLSGSGGVIGVGKVMK